MKITEVNTYLVRPRWGFVEIVTDDGYSGWGEAVLEGHASTVLECVREMRDYLLVLIQRELRIYLMYFTGLDFTGAAVS